MNRRNFLAGLLATTAAVPLAKAGFAAVKPVIAWDIGVGDATNVFMMQRSEMTYLLSENMYQAAARQAWGPALMRMVKEIPILDAKPVPERIFADVNLWPMGYTEGDWRDL